MCSAWQGHSYSSQVLMTTKYFKWAQNLHFLCEVLTFSACITLYLFTLHFTGHFTAHSLILKVHLVLGCWWTLWLLCWVNLNMMKRLAHISIQSHYFYFFVFSFIYYLITKGTVQETTLWSFNVLTSFGKSLFRKPPGNSDNILYPCTC